MPSVIDQYEVILTTMVELKSEGDSKCSSKATSHTRAMESFDFIIGLWLVTWRVFLDFLIAAINYVVVDSVSVFAF